MTLWTPGTAVDVRDVPADLVSGRRARRAAVGDDWERSGAGLYVPPEVGGRAIYGERPIAIDLFAGAGGFSCGFFKAGIRVVAALEWDPDCAMTYTVNMGTHPMRFVWIEPKDEARMNKALEAQTKRDKRAGVALPMTTGSGWLASAPELRPGVPFFFLGDARKITGQELLATLGLKPGDIDVVCGGPPCQGFSTGGKRNVMDPRNSLVFEFARLVLEIQPKSMVMENVPGMVTMTTAEGIPVVDALCRILSDGGFGAFDALKRSILSTAGLAGAMKGGRRSRDDDREDEVADAVRAVARETRVRKVHTEQLALELSA